MWAAGSTVFLRPHLVGSSTRPEQLLPLGKSVGNSNIKKAAQ